MKKSYLSILSYLLVLALSSEEESVEEIVSIASKNPKNIKEVNATIDIIDKNDLKRQAPRDFKSVLSNTLALDTSSNGGPGQYASIFLRGTNSNHTQVKINGVKINPYTAGGASINNLDPSLIAQIEIGSGPFSSIHGSEAIGGVINISTIQDEEDSLLQLAISGGADNFMRKSLQKNWEEKNKSFNILLLNSKTNGFPSRSNSSIDRGYINKSIVSSFNLKSERIKAQFSTWISRGDTEYLGFQGDPLSQNYQNTAYSLEVKRRVRNFNLIALNLSSSKDLIHQNQENYLGLKDITETDSHNFEIMFHKTRNKNLSFVTGYVQERQKVNYSSFGTQFEKKLKIPDYYTSRISKLSISMVEQLLDDSSVIKNDEKRKDNNKLYFDLLNKEKNINIIPIKDFNFQNFLDFPIIVKNKKKLINYLYNYGLEVRTHFYSNCENLIELQNNKNSQYLDGNIICLPSHHDIDSNKIKEYCFRIEKF